MIAYLDTDCGAPVEEKKTDKKGVDVNALMNSAKDGVGKGVGFINKLYGEDTKKGILFSQLIPAVMAVLALVMGAGAVPFILFVLLAAVNYLGLDALKKSVCPAEEEKPAE